jgi:hypothetical protein
MSKRGRRSVNCLAVRLACEMLEHRTMLSASLSFGRETSVPTGDGSHNVLTTDLNGDGKLDLITTNQNSSTQAGFFSVALGDGHGGFGSPTAYSGFEGSIASNSPTFADLSIVSGDFNKDGLPDLALSSGNSGTVTIFLNHTNMPGVLTEGAQYSLPAGLEDIVAGHFTTSANIDLAVIQGSNNSIELLTGNGDGTFTPKSHTTVLPGSVFDSNISVGALSHGLDDLVLSMDAAVNVSIFTPDAATLSGFDAVVNHSGGGFSLSIGDVNGDGNLDVISSQNNGISVLFGDGHGSLVAPVFSGTALTNGLPIVTGDFDGDGKLDVAVGDGDGNDPGTIQILQGDGLGGFTLEQTVPAGGVSNNIVTGDFNNDGHPDFAVATDDFKGRARTYFGNGAIVVVSGAEPATNTVSVADTVVQGRSGANAIFTITRHGDLSGFATVQYTTSDGTASFTDYDGTSGSVTFRPGGDTENIDVPVRVDPTVSGPVAFNVTLSNPVLVNIASGQGTATGTIDADIPKAGTINVNTLEGVLVSIPVLAVAVDPLGESLSVGVGQFGFPQDGNVSTNDIGTPNGAGGYLVYIPMISDVTDPVLDSFSYTVTNADGYSATGTVDVTINPSQGTTGAPDIFVTTGENVPVSIDVLGSNSVMSGQSIVPYFMDPASNGSVQLDDGGSPSIFGSAGDTLIYTPNAGYIGSDSFPYELASQMGLESGTVFITVNDPGSSAPPQGAFVEFSGQTHSPTILPVLDYSSASSGGTLEIVPSSNHLTAQGGKISIVTDQFSGEQEFQYTSKAGFTGLDSYDYQVTDGFQVSSTATVFIQVNSQPIQLGINPIAMGTATQTVPIDVLATADDFNGVSAEIVPFTGGTLTTSLGGTVSIGMNMSGAQILNYVPPSGGLTSGQVDSFNYTLTDSTGTTTEGSVTVAYDRGPTLSNFTLNVLGQNQTLLNILSHASATDSPISQAFYLTSPSNGYISQSSGLVYVPYSNQTATDSFTVGVEDDLGVVVTATVTVHQTFEAPPIANDFTINVPPNVTTPIDVLSHASAAAGDTLIFYGVSSGPSNGTYDYDFTNPADILVDYTPNSGATSDTFMYLVDDGGGFSSGTVTVNVVATSETDLSGTDLYAKRVGSNLDVWNGTNASGTLLFDSALTGITSLHITASHSLTVDFAAGDPLPDSGLDFSGPDLNILGSTGAETVVVDGTTVGVGSASIRYTNTTAINFSGIGGNDVLTQNAQPGGGASLSFLDMNASDTINVNGGVFTFPLSTASTVTSEILGTLDITNGAEAVVASPGVHGSRFVLKLCTLSIAGSLNNWNGLLDLTGNDMDVVGGGLTTIYNQLKAGFNHGRWNGTTGIISSTAHGDTRFLRTLGYRAGGVTFDSINSGANDVLVKYTYYGDADLSGAVNGADYQQIDSGFGMHSTGWMKGDFNYDGIVDGTDYSLIDNTVNQISSTGATPLVLVAGAPIAVARASALSSNSVSPFAEDNKEKTSWADDVLDLIK